MAAIKLVTATVAQRKTVLFDGKYLGPGSEVSLPADEVAELRALGFLVDPAAQDAIAVGAGPVFDDVVPTISAGK